MTLEELFSINIGLHVIALGAFSLLCGIVLLSLLLPRITRLLHHIKNNNETETDSTVWPGVSVIVYSQGDGWNLYELLTSIFAQDYPGQMEVIVVNDESADATEKIVSEMEMSHPNLYMTFAPEKSRNLSRKKLSITLGIKAARHDAVLLTCGNCRIKSTLWLRSMMRHVQSGKEVVIGYALPVAAEGIEKNERRRRCAFDHVWESVRYLGSALNGKPFMGNGNNLLYSRRLFFEHKGFSETLNLTYGDDDIFINEITTSDNTAVELSPDSRVEVIEHSPSYMHDIYRMRREFTSRFLPHGAYRYMGAISLLWWLWASSSLFTIIAGLPNLFPIVIVTTINLIVCIPAMVMWRRISTALGSRRLLLTVPWLSLWHPFYAIKIRLKAFRNRRKNYTWGTKI